MRTPSIVQESRGAFGCHRGWTEGSSGHERECTSRSGLRESSSARPLMTRPSRGAPSQRQVPPARKLVLFTIESTKVVGTPQCSKRTSPGSPPPLPRSRNRRGRCEPKSSHTCEEAMSVLNLSLDGYRAQKAPRPRFLEGAVQPLDLSRIQLCRRNHHEAAWLLTFGASDHRGGSESAS